MPRIPEHVIDAIQARADIAEVIGRMVPLKRAGRHFKGLCPFHKERTPSFIVNTDKQIYHCFGCGSGGNVFSFLMQHDRLEFPEAVGHLAEQFGISIPEDTERSPRLAQASETARVTEMACKYFERVLAHPSYGKETRAYVTGRGVSAQASKRFRMGFSRSGWRHLVTAAQASGISPEQLETAGLVIRSDSGWYDRFRNRLIFAIQDTRGRVVGFGGRSMDDQPPKYLNSPETPLYVKGQHLFGLAQAKEAITKLRRAVIVEGYFDCVVLAGAGIEEVVSPLGTALTTDQVRLLKRYAERVVLAFDPDAAGEAATLRGIELLVEAGLEVAVATVPDGLDPDEYVEKHGVEALKRVFEKASTIFEVLLQHARSRHPGARVEDRVSAARMVLPTIAKVPDAILQREYVRQLADSLQLDEAAVVTELGKITRRPNKSARMAQAPVTVFRSVAANAAIGPERLLTALVLDDPQRLERVTAGFSFAQVRDADLRSLLEMLEKAVKDGAATSAQVVSRLSAEGHEVLVSALLALSQTLEDPETALEECLRRLQTQAKAGQLQALREQLRVAQESGRENDVYQLLNEYQQQVKSSSK